MNEKLHTIPARQKFHPDMPSTGWSMDIQNAAGMLVARVYGENKAQAERRCAALMSSYED